MDVTKWKFLVVVVVVGSVCSCKQSNQPEDRGDIAETDSTNGGNDFSSSNDSGPLPPESQTLSIVPSTDVTFDEVVPPFLLSAILKVGMSADGSRHRYLGRDDTWHYVAAGQSDRVLVAPVGAVDPEWLSPVLEPEEYWTLRLDQKSGHVSPLSAAVQAFCESHSSLTTAPWVDASADANVEPCDDDDEDSPYPQRDGLFFVTVAPDLAFYALLQYPVDGGMLGDFYLGRDEEYHYIADEWDPIIWCCKIEHIAQDDLEAVVESQRERSEAFFDMARENPGIPFSSRPDQSAQQAWSESHVLIQIEDQERQ